MNPRRIAWLAALLLGTMASAHATEVVVYYHTDALHSTTVVTNAQGQVIERTHYAPYGAVLNRALRDGPGYAGHEEDAATGLVYMQQRYYDPESGTFLSTDPVQADAGMGFNRYAYANGNPYRYTDPDGRSTGTLLGDDEFNTSPVPLGQWQARKPKYHGTDRYVVQAFKFACSVSNGVLSDINEEEQAAISGKPMPLGATLRLWLTFSPLSLETPELDIASGAAGTTRMTTVLGSRADVAQFVGKPGFNTFTGKGIPAVELNRANLQWLHDAFERGDTILLKTDPAAHARFLSTLPNSPRSAYLDLELPEIQKYNYLNVITDYGATVDGK